MRNTKSLSHTHTRAEAGAQVSRSSGVSSNRWLMNLFVLGETLTCLHNTHGQIFSKSAYLFRRKRINKNNKQLLLLMWLLFRALIDYWWSSRGCTLVFVSFVFLVFLPLSPVHTPSRSLFPPQARDSLTCPLTSTWVLYRAARAVRSRADHFECFISPADFRFEKRFENF